MTLQGPAVSPGRRMPKSIEPSMSASCGPSNDSGRIDITLTLLDDDDKSLRIRMTHVEEEQFRDSLNKALGSLERLYQENG